MADRRGGRGAPRASAQQRAAPRARVQCRDRLADARAPNPGRRRAPNPAGVGRAGVGRAGLGLLCVGRSASVSPASVWPRAPGSPGAPGSGSSPPTCSSSACCEARLVHLGRLHRIPAGPVSQRQRGYPPHVGGRRRVPALPGSQGGGGPADRQVGPEPLGPHGRTQRRHLFDHLVAHTRRPGLTQPAAQISLRGRHLAGGQGPDRVGVECQTPPYRRRPLGRVACRPHPDRQPETVQQLRPQVPLLRVHGPDQQEAAGVDVGDALPLHPVDAAGGHVQEHVHQVIREQVDLIDVEDSAVRGRDQTGAEPLAAARQRRGQIDRPNHAILGGAQRQLHERGRPGKQSRQAPGQRGLGRALLSPQENAADPGVDGDQQERQLGVVLADHRRQRQLRRRRRRRPGVTHRDSSQPSPSRTAPRSVSRAVGDADHRPRSAASRSRSAMARRAHGFDASRNLRIRGSAT